MTFGQKAERKMIKVLLRNGYDALPASRIEDKKFKVDFWVRKNEYWLPIQFSLNREAIVGWKGLDALKRGIIPMWIEDRELEIAFFSENGIGLVKEFWSRVDKILETYPKLKRFRKAHWTRTQQLLN